MKSVLVVLLVAALGCFATPVVHAAAVKPRPLTAAESSRLAIEEVESAQQLADVEAGSIGTFFGLVVLAGAVVVAAIVISDE